MSSTAYREPPTTQESRELGDLKRLKSLIGRPQEEPFTIEKLFSLHNLEQKTSAPKK